MSTNKKEKIISAARKLFSEYGFSSTTTESIAQAVGIKKPSIYHFFTNKEEIYFIVLKLILRDVSDIFNKASDNGDVDELAKVILKVLKLGRSMGMGIIFTTDQTDYCKSAHLSDFKDQYQEMKNSIIKKLSIWKVPKAHFAVDVLIDCQQLYLTRLVHNEKQPSMKIFARELAELIFRK